MHDVYLDGTDNVMYTDCAVYLPYGVNSKVRLVCTDAVAVVDDLILSMCDVLCLLLPQLRYRGNIYHWHAHLIIAS